MPHEGQWGAHLRICLHNTCDWYIMLTQNPFKHIYFIYNLHILDLNLNNFINLFKYIKIHLFRSTEKRVHEPLLGSPTKWQQCPGQSHKPGARNLIWISHRVAGVQALGPSSVTLSRLLAGYWIGSGTVRTEITALLQVPQVVALSATQCQLQSHHVEQVHFLWHLACSSWSCKFLMKEVIAQVNVLWKGINI